MSGPKKKLTPAMLALAKEMRFVGVSQKVIAIDLDVSETTVSNALREQRAYAVKPRC